MLATAFSEYLSGKSGSSSHSRQAGWVGGRGVREEMFGKRGGRTGDGGGVGGNDWEGRGVTLSRDP